MAQHRVSTRLAKAQIKSMKEASDSEDEEEAAASLEDEEEEDDHEEHIVHEERRAARVPRIAGGAKGLQVHNLDAAVAALLHPERGSGGPARKRARRTADGKAQLEPASLLELLAKRPESAAAAAKAWVARYQRDEVAATAELLTLMVQAAGACVVVSDADVEEGDVDTLATRVSDEVMRSGGADPMHDRRTARTLPLGFAAFITSLVSAMDDAELLAREVDDFALERLTSLAVVLSSAAIRPFRLAATLAASRLVGALVEARKKRSTAAGTAQFQLEAEGKKGRAANQAVVTSLKARLGGLQRQSVALTAMIDSLAKDVFGVRFRDTQPEVRALVIASVGSWVAADPAAFLSDTYLKYLGWALSDKDGGVRSIALTALAAAYRSPDNVAGLRGFKDRFIDRLCELPRDVEEHVAVQALELLARLVHLEEVALPDVQRLSLFLADSSAAIRDGAAHVMSAVIDRLAAARLQEQAEQQPAAAAAAVAEGAQPSAGAAAGVLPAAGASRSPAPRRATRGAAAAAAAAAAASGTPPRHPAPERMVAAQAAVLLDLLAWMMQEAAAGAGADDGQGGMPGTRGSSEPSHPAAPLEPEAVALVADALRDHCPALQSVGPWVAVLQSAAQAGEAGPRAVHAASLLADVAARAAAAAAAGERARQPGGGGAPLQPRKRKRVGRPAGGWPYQSREAVSQALMAPLPTLMRQYQTDPAVLAPLLRAVRAVALDVFAASGEERSAGALLALVSEQVGRHAEPGVVREAAEALVEAASSGPGSLRGAAQAALDAAVARAGSGLAAAASAALALSPRELAAEVAELQASAVDGGPAGAAVPEGAEALWRLRVALLRAGGLLAAGALNAGNHAGLRNALGNLLDAAAGLQPQPGSGGNPEGGQSSGPPEPRPLGAGITALLLAAAQAVLLCGVVDAGGLDEGGQAPSGAAAATKLAGDVAAHGRRLAALADVVQLPRRHGPPLADSATALTLLLAISDLLLCFAGAATWAGTGAAGVTLPQPLADDLLRRLADGCAAFVEFDDPPPLGEEGEAMDDEDGEGEDRRDGHGDSPAAAVRRLQAVGALARLVLSPTALTAVQAKRAAGRLIALLACPYVNLETPVGIAVRDLVTALRRRARDTLPSDTHGAAGTLVPGAVLAALQHWYAPVADAHDAGADDDVLEPALVAFSAAAVDIATALYAVPGVHREEVVAVVRRGLAWVLSSPAHLRARSYLAAWGLPAFVAKLTPADAAALVGDAAAAVARGEADVPRLPPASPRTTSGDGEGDTPAVDPQWAQLDHFVSHLTQRAARGAAGGGGRRGGPPKRAAAALRIDADDDDDDDDQDGGEPGTRAARHWDAGRAGDTSSPMQPPALLAADGAASPRSAPPRELAAAAAAIASPAPHAPPEQPLQPQQQQPSSPQPSSLAPSQPPPRALGRARRKRGGGAAG